MKRKLLAVLLAMSMVFVPAAVSAEENTRTTEDNITDMKISDNGITDITIYHTNDTHGYLTGDGTDVVGMALVGGLKEADPDSILVDAGDATQGLPIASLTQGNDVIELMNLAGYDLMTAGNHEFDFGTEAFLKNVRLADFPVLAANIYKDGAPLLKGVQEGNSGCHTIIERNGKKIGFFGLTTVQTATATNPSGISDLEFLEETEIAKDEIDELEAADVDAIVAVCHLGNGDAPCTAPELAESLTGAYEGKVDAIIDGHSHTLENETVNGVQIVQTGYGMSAVGELTLTFTGEEVTAVTEKLLKPSDLNQIRPSSSVEEKLQQITDSQADLLQEKAGEAQTTLWAGWIGDIAMTRLVETNYGNFAADAFLNAGTAIVQSNGTEEEKQMPVIAVENGGGIREAVANGTITKGDLISTFPFSNTLYMKKITPAVLYQMMEQSGSLLAGQDQNTGMLLQKQISGGFLQIGGFKVVFNPDGENGNRVVSVTLDGQKKALDRNDTKTAILLVSNNYIMSGGNDYTMLADLPKYREAGGELETIQEYLKQCLAQGIMDQYAGTQGRISYTGSVYQPKDYTVSVKITDEAGVPLENKELSYRVDGGKRTNGTTDAQGLLKIQVSDGGHGIRLSDAQKEIYVDNYTGLGIAEDDLRQIPVLTFLSDGSCDPIADETEGETEKNPPSEEPKIPNDQTEKENKNPETNMETVSESEAVKTGDESFLIFWVIVSGAGAAGIVLLTAKVKQKI
ncbi:Trifunctional nucleotide phosphoesterase protein YfkN precursor [uncultured Roseburia sp.]|uniref:Bifunctional metallophosphatase/5'-nucleotidase n=1 Tax=Brotonthovivens ammoniilytica TaxID=2981725 RepID=A0ABT2TG73_9FIRM|nr:bifunctional UDP-sugar hydrolase/5'-nucleotidase [Brotonthovivens ammoniilytica]MCU6761193.1 bifunctional metallophosphatase/5'-nucleotidase [Brotonthovivens ammoniilytica]SCI21554.1 Trifunctional nucleotide phosphoesterase protein YfkN precursor [uncultured Roseburia sp.]